jgi:hypothetical protein
VKLRIITTILFGGLCLLPADSWSYNPYTTATGEVLRWWTDQLDYTIDDRVPESLDTELVANAIDDAFGRWSGLDCHPMDTTSLGWGTCYGDQGGDGTNCVYWVSAPGMWTEASWLVAATYLHFYDDTGEIFDADVAVNIQGHPFEATLGCLEEQDTYDLEATIVHEVGHVLGLNHSQETFATMNAVTFPGDCKKRTLNDDDIAGFCASYSDPLPDATDADTPSPDAQIGPDGDATAVQDAQPAPEPSPPTDDGCQSGHGVPSLLLLMISFWPLSRRSRRRAPGPAPARS